MLSNPQPAAAALVDLVDEGQVLVALVPGDLVDAEGHDVGAVDAGATPDDGHGDGASDTILGDAADRGGLLQEEVLGPAGEGPAEGLAAGVLSVGPRHAFDLDPATTSAADGARGVREEDEQAIEGVSWNRRVGRRS